MIPTALGKPEFILSQCIRDIKLALKTMGMTSMQAVQRRCLDLCSKLVGAAKELADTNKPLDDTIFGPNLKKHFTNILQVNKINKMAASLKSCGCNNRYNFLLGGCS